MQSTRAAQWSSSPDKRNMTFIQIIDEEPDKLRQQSWRFWYHDNRHALVLDYYAIEARNSRRHKYRTVAVYARINLRDSTLKNESDVPLPESVMVRARVQFNEKLRVCKWSDVK